MRRQRLRVLALAWVAASAIAGCRIGDEEAAPDATPAPAGDTATEAPSMARKLTMPRPPGCRWLLPAPTVPATIPCC
jgi:hypothetical protein